MIHLTNDAIQKGSKDYGRYEKGNKISYEEFEKYLRENFNEQYSFYRQILPKVKEICTDVIKGSYHVVEPLRRVNNFEIFGLDIMID